MRHPPGSTVSTRPSRARSGAQNKMDARIRAAASGARRQVEGTPCTVMSLPCQRAVQPAPCKSSTLVSTSARCGTCRKRTVPLHKRAAASSGSTLFLAAGMCTVPFSGMPPVMIRSPPMQKPPFRKRYLMLCGAKTFCLFCLQLCHLFVRSFVAAPAEDAVVLWQGTPGFMSPRGTPTARCPFRPAASSDWCRRRKKTAG